MTAAVLVLTAQLLTPSHLFGLLDATALTTPTTAYALAWDYVGPPPVDHFEVRYEATAAWANVGTATQTAVPALLPGAYTAEVRACALPEPSTCPSAALAFTVTAGQVTPPPVTNPTKIEFVASADHALLVNGTAVVTGYQLDTMTSSTTGALAFSISLGKPTPAATTNLITVPVSQLGTLANGVYVATVSTLGPGGNGKSTPSAPFSRIGPAAAPTGVRAIP